MEKMNGYVRFTNEEILKQIECIIENPDIIRVYGMKAYLCAVKNHEKVMMNHRFIETICNAVEYNKN